MTTKEILARDWGALRGKVRERWHSLSDEDVENIGGNYAVLVSMVQERYGYSKEHAQREVNNLLNEHVMATSPLHP